MTKLIEIEMDGVTEYCEGMPVHLLESTKDPYTFKLIDRWVIQAANEGGHNSTEVDLVDLLLWLKKNKPDLLKEVLEK